MQSAQVVTLKSGQQKVSSVDSNLNQVRIRNGRNYRYPRRVVERHRANQLECGQCGDCYKVVRKRGSKRA